MRFFSDPPAALCAALLILLPFPAVATGADTAARLAAFEQGNRLADGGFEGAAGAWRFENGHITREA
ncbi:MAG: hypothetical protein ACE5FC_02185, partial [Myxococcota bacterium]